MVWKFTEDRPIYTQLVEQLQLRIAMGQYPPGGKFPSVRELASEAAVNPNTMQRALTQLESNGLLYSERTAGRFVTKEADRIMQMKKEMAQNLMAEFLRGMRELGFTKEQTIRLLQQMEEESI